MLENFNFLNGEVSIIRIIMIIYLFILANTLSSRVSEKIMYKLNERYILKHFIGVITIGILLSLVYSLNYKDLIFYSLLIYFIFLLSTKISSELIVMIVTILGGLYFYDYFIDSKISQVHNDKIIDNYKKNMIIADKKDKKKNISLFMIAIIICGSLLYENKKQGQFGGNFSMWRFLN